MHHSAPTDAFQHQAFVALSLCLSSLASCSCWSTNPEFYPADKRVPLTGPTQLCLLSLSCPWLYLWQQNMSQNRVILRPEEVPSEPQNLNSPSGLWIHCPGQQGKRAGLVRRGAKAVCLWWFELSPYGMLHTIIPDSIHSPPFIDSSLQRNNVTISFHYYMVLPYSKLKWLAHTMWTEKQQLSLLGLREDLSGPAPTLPPILWSFTPVHLSVSSFSF